MTIKIYTGGGCLRGIFVDGQEVTDYTLVDYDVMKEMGFDEDQEDEYLAYIKELYNASE